MEGRIHSIETFGTVDGPGIRYVIFMQGCKFRCKYCHNPDTWNLTQGEVQTVDQLVEDIVKYKRYIDGVTVSGGEPLLQIDFVTELFQKVKENNLSTCLDTAGYVFDKSNSEEVCKIDKLLSFTDLVMLDLKHIDQQKHKDLTGFTNKNVLEFAEYLSLRNKKMWLRYVLVPTINDDYTTLKQWREFVDNLKTVEKIEVLPYHSLALEKYKKLGIEYPLKNIQEPTKVEIEKAKEILKIKEEA